MRCLSDIVVIEDFNAGDFVSDDVKYQHAF
jgi:hypothetical protein